MPKIIELTFELNVDKVSCPGVWLCQDGRVSLTVFALGTSYQTCLLPPIFPLLYKDIFYFRKRFQETCTLSNICCLLKEETIYCELVQWCEDCGSNRCIMLAQYLGALNDVLFPPNLCSNEGVDLLMRRSKEFPGILSPKIEVSTKVRIDEVWDQPCNLPPKPPKIKACSCSKPETDPARQKQVCHTPLYHRVRCTKNPTSRSRSRSDSRSCCSLAVKEPDFNIDCQHPAHDCARSRTSLLSSKHKDRCRQYHQYNVYNVEMPTVESTWRAATNANAATDSDSSEYDYDFRNINAGTLAGDVQKPLIESQFIETPPSPNIRGLKKKHSKIKINPCVCEICRRYHELFHPTRSVSS